MTANRDKDTDKKATLEVLQSINKGKIYKLDKTAISWLGHTDAGAQLDRLLAFGATMEQLKAERKTIHTHFTHLKDKHGIEVIKVDGVHRMVVKE
jgi:hypothetical protein